MWSSFQIPRSFGVIRPSGRTAAASVKTRPAPPTARLPRWTRCQSLAKPSRLEYWHISETAMRLGRVRSRKVIGEKRSVIAVRFVGARSGCCNRLAERAMLAMTTEEFWEQAARENGITDMEIVAEARKQALKDLN